MFYRECVQTTKNDMYNHLNGVFVYKHRGSSIAEQHLGIYSENCFYYGDKIQ